MAVGTPKLDRSRLIVDVIIPALDEEETIGVTCVAAPVSHTGATPAAAVGVTALAAQLHELTRDAVSARVVGAAQALSLLLGERVQPLDLVQDKR